MKKFLIVILCCFSSAIAFANCESTIEEGQHISATQQYAISSALEEAVDNCYPGAAEPLNAHCQSINRKGEEYFQCTQKVSCTLCADDLTRKYEALD
ncbi:hypothetical protein [Marinagarivorans algicola]|uniref:hypothetical protein n=1 Tax=Marinagarivorans algicola TaxID=1513270 RepID=UPI0006B46C4C|nr:hypothetical protein [Marinagarivorans algicola]